MHNIVLDDNNFIMYAAKYYSNAGCYDTDEFYDDLNIFKYILRLMNRYRETGDLQERLILNHIIIAYNLWGIPAATRMLFYRLQGHETSLKSFLLFIGCMPDIISNIGSPPKCYKYNEIDVDPLIIERLQQI